MGFAGLFSTKSETTQYVQNRQVGQSGAGSFAISGDLGTNTGDVNVVSNDPSIAIAAINAAGQNQITALETLRSVSNRFSDVAENAVGTAQQTALNALPLTPEQISASRGDATKEQTQKMLVIAAGVIAGAILLALVIKKFKS